MAILTKSQLAPWKKIQHSLGLWVPPCIFRIPGTGFQSLSVELGFRISIFNGIPDSLSYIPDSKAQDSGPHRQNFFRILDSTRKNFVDSRIGFPYMVRKSSLKMTISHLLRGPGTVWEESLNPNARLLGKVETNYKMAASDGERSTPTILRKNRGT